MSTLEREPAEVRLGAAGTETSDDRAADPRVVDVLEPRDVPLGGPRAMRVRRTLPQRRRSLIGAWCFVDHYGPDAVVGPRAMDVPPHPHTGLQTASWLFAGEIEHRDSAGSFALVRPGELDLMTAGRGIQHSEYSTGTGAVLHGVQLWIALPDAARNDPPRFEQYRTVATPIGSATVRVFLGRVGEAASPVATATPLLGAQLELPAGAVVDLPVDPTFEHGVLVDAGSARVEGVEVAESQLGALGTGRSIIRIEAGDSHLRALVLGGPPFDEPIVMWWNFVGRDHEEIVRFRNEWQAQLDTPNDAGRFGKIDDPSPPLAAPALPNARLRPRA